MSAVAMVTALRTKDTGRGNAWRRNFCCGEPGGGSAQIRCSRKACATTFSSVRHCPCPRQACSQGGRGQASALEPSGPVTVFEDGGDNTAGPPTVFCQAECGKRPCSPHPGLLSGRAARARGCRHCSPPPNLCPWLSWWPQGRRGQHPLLPQHHTGVDNSTVCPATLRSTDKA